MEDELKFYQDLYVAALKGGFQYPVKIVEEAIRNFNSFKKTLKSKSTTIPLSYVSLSTKLYNRLYRNGFIIDHRELDIKLLTSYTREEFKKLKYMGEPFMKEVDFLFESLELKYK